jgi:outer membrane protein assembly factor BamA
VVALSLGGGISAGEARETTFYLGGYPEQDLLGALINQSPLGGNYLRGYLPGVIGGSQYHLLNAEYRFPLWNVERGLSTLPVFLSHVWLAAFCDVGGAFEADLDVDELLVGVGAEILFRVVIGYQLALTFRLGYARGLMEDGQNEVFFVMGVPY